MISIYAIVGIAVCTVRVFQLYHAPGWRVASGMTIGVVILLMILLAALRGMRGTFGQNYAKSKMLRVPSATRRP